ncbi:hypothetical protein BLNAU_6671 [Blattamonas nauphoetae]|uniref:Uncharacterized protein n=1 Tax=Blattamonas nauphoetae TaxID=2049346 RepID=A0ABQ9Y3U4_9EUKA|nr:hypothetical protein BLNAU_6671 [Blattamonas nauphoetae]
MRRKTRSVRGKQASSKSPTRLSPSTSPPSPISHTLPSFSPTPTSPSKPPHFATTPCLKSSHQLVATSTARAARCMLARSLEETDSRHFLIGSHRPRTVLLPSRHKH